MPLDIFDYHRAVIDENADRKGKSPQRHRVECLPTNVHHQERGNDGERNRREDDHASAGRQLPSKRRIIKAVRPAAMAPPMTTLFNAALTKMD